MNILIIDDNETILDIIKQSLLYKSSHDITTMHSGVDGLKEFTENPDKYDLVISDMKMPNVDGIELIQRIKKINPNTKIIGMSGGGVFDYLQLAKEFGADDLIYKPFSVDELIERIDSVIQKKSPS